MDETISAVPAVATAGGLPTRLGKYEILTPLATGGMARIYIARTTGIGSFERHVVLKLITPERANDNHAVQMFLDEARLAASLNHQNVAQVFEVGEDAGIHYLAMEYVHGQDLRALLAKAGSQGVRVPLELALTVVAGAAAGLHHAHERRDGNGVPLGIVHRDVSPSNIMIGVDGAVKLLDFGIAKATSRSVETQSGIIKGKFAYMSPEQCRGREVDRRSDVFSLGIILYEITTQHRCFRADSDFDTMHRIVTGDVVRPTRLVQGYPQALEAIVMKALAVDPNQRYQSGGMLLEALESFSVSARMSLSTMALGRFMRELFGETPEPWLAAAKNGHLLEPKESTISSTNASDQVIRAAPHYPNEPAYQPSGGDNSAAAHTLLDLPRDHERDHRDIDHHDDHEHVSWNAKSYPTTADPVYASAMTMPPEQLVRGAAMETIPTPTLGGGMSDLDETNAIHPTPVPPPLPPRGSQPPPLAQASSPGAPAFGGAAAASAAAASAAAAAAVAASSGSSIANAKPGYAAAPHPDSSVSGLAYPLYEGPSNEVVDDEAVQLTPSRKALYVGIAIVLIGVGVVLAIAFTGGRSNDITPAVTPGSAEQQQPAPQQAPAQQPETQQPAQQQAAPTEQPQPQVAPAPAPQAGSGEQPQQADQPPTVGTAPVNDPTDEFVSIRVTSDPPKADVMLAGQVIGTTPLDIKRPKTTGLAHLTVHKAGYTDYTTKIDMSGDSEKKIELVKIGDTSKKSSETGTKKPSQKTEKKSSSSEKKTVPTPPVIDKKVIPPPPPPPPPPAPKCQPPGKYNELDTSCNGQACPPCKE